MRELAKKQKQEEKKERKKARQDPQPEGDVAAPVAEQQHGSDLGASS